LIGAVAASISLMGVAHGQSTTTDFGAYNISVRAGVSLPFDTNLSNYSNPLLDLGAEYQFSRALLPGTDTYFSIDYISRNLSFADGVIPICINERFYLKSDHRAGRRVYAFAGIGGAIISIPGGSSSGVVAARGGLGTDLGENIFFEVDGTLSDLGSTARADTVGFCLGYRF
jgi:hypothetical protein